MKQIRPWIVALAVLLLAWFPYWLAFRSTTPDQVFGGFLLNPIDGNSYLAKMYEGWAGAWTFTLPYTAQPGEGSYLFLFYLLLGHLSRILGLSLISMFHTARLVGTTALLCTLFWFFRSVFPRSPLAVSAFSLAALGAGLGWIAYPLGGLLTPDFWVPEAYPFLSAYANPHFPLALAILLWLVAEGRESPSLTRLAGLFLGGLALAILLPFGIVISTAVLFIDGLWTWLETRKLRWQGLAAQSLGGAPVLVYQFWVSRANPALAAWSSQNQTPSPPLLLLVLGLSPVLILAVIGGIRAIRCQDPGGRLLVAWSLVCLGLMYVPFSLQRRFMLGLFIPLAGLAVLGLHELARGELRRFRLVETGIAVLSFPTILMVVLTGIFGIQTQDPSLYLSRGEIQAMEWIRQNTASGDLVLASPETGLFIPAYTGRRVLYGHPFETVDAENQRKIVEQLIRGGLLAEEQTREIKYIFFGPRETRLAETPPNWNYPVAYEANGVTLYDIHALK